MKSLSPFVTEKVQLTVLPGRAEWGQSKITPKLIGMNGVGVGVGFPVGVFVGVLVGVPPQARIWTEFVVEPDNGDPVVPFVPLTMSSFWRKMSCAPQSGAVSVQVPVQVSVPLLAGPSVVTGSPFWLQTTGTGVGDPSQPVGLGQGTMFETARLSAESPPAFVIEKVQVMVLPGDAV